MDQSHTHHNVQTSKFDLWKIFCYFHVSSNLHIDGSYFILFLYFFQPVLPYDIYTGKMGILDRLYRALGYFTYFSVQGSDLDQVYVLMSWIKRI